MSLLDELARQEAAEAGREEFPPLDAGSVAAQVLLAAWQGDPALLVTSPPGAGKSRLLVTVGGHLGGRGNMLVAVACQTLQQTHDLANRYAQFPGVPVTVLGASRAERPRGLEGRVNFTTAVDELPTSGVVISSTKKWQWVNPDQFSADILMVDEAYQSTWMDFVAASLVARQTLLVGDPGQIPPVVTGMVGRYESHPMAPHAPAPVVFARTHQSRLRLWQLPDSWRCGPDTVALLQPLYQFKFGSRRPQRTYAAGGAAAPEVLIDRVAGRGGVNDPVVAARIVEHVYTFLGQGTLQDKGEDDREVSPTDIAVVAAHNSQVAAVRARLTHELRDVTVATTEQLQGAEFPLVVAWSQFSGKSSLSGFDLQTGRLCVMLSRHSHHLTFVEAEGTDERVDVALQDEPVSTSDAATLRTVRAAMRC